MYICNEIWLFSVNLSDVDLIIRPSERTSRIEKFLPRPCPHRWPQSISSLLCINLVHLPLQTCSSPYILYLCIAPYSHSPKLQIMALSSFISYSQPTAKHHYILSPGCSFTSVFSLLNPPHPHDFGHAVPLAKS